MCWVAKPSHEKENSMTYLLFHMEWRTFGHLRKMAEKSF